jgi:hypothetical protein
MFFSIGHSHKSNFPCHWQLGDLSVSTDQGWTLTTDGTVTRLCKGYAVDGVITAGADGNFCVFEYNGNQTNIHSSQPRSFPIYYDATEITNLRPLINTVWSDRTVVVAQDLAVTQHKFNAVGSFDLDEIGHADAVDAIDRILLSRTEKFLSHNTLPVKAFVSGGVDSLLVYSYLHKLGADVELVNYLHTDLDWFYTHNHHDLKQFWGYTLILHWRDPCVLTSGAPGDEFMLRSPVTANWYLHHHGTSLPELVKQNPRCLHAEYFGLPKHQKLFDQPQPVFDKTWQLNWHLCKTVLNDWQHWHLGNTLTWTPLRDLDIFKLFLRLPLSSAQNQILNSSISIELIERNAPGLSLVISDQKNSGNYMSNLHRLPKF